MKISYNWLKKYIQISLTPEQIDQILTGLGIEVEKIEDYSKKIQQLCNRKGFEK